MCCFTKSKMYDFTHEPGIAATVNTAARLAPPNLRDDARQEAWIGVIQAAHSFDVSKGIKFRTWASIRAHGAVRDLIRRSTPGERQSTGSRVVLMPLMDEVYELPEPVRDDPPVTDWEMQRMYGRLPARLRKFVRLQVAGLDVVHTSRALGITLYRAYLLRDETIAALRAMIGK